MSQPSVKLTPQELDRALSYIEATRASDFFPQPFEFQAIDIKKKNWGESVGSPQGFTITAHESQNLVWGVGKVS
jgi:hypothetical protein